MGSSQIDGRRVYGKFYAYGSMGPTRIPRGIFKENRDILEEAEFTSDWINSRTGGKLSSNIKFKSYTLKKYNWDILVEIARVLNIKFVKQKRDDSYIKRSLIRSILIKLEEL
jgi:hypothetical protein